MNEPTNQYEYEVENLQLHKEELEITKKWVDTEEVMIYRRTYTVDKQITVPVTHEELVIERKSLPLDGAVKPPEQSTIRIPLSEERVKVTKYPIMLEDIEIYKHQFKELVQIHETMKKEILRVDTIGEVNVKETH